MRPLVGLLGKSIGRSLSPALHEAAGANLGMDIRYQLFDAEELNYGAEDLGDFLSVASRLGFFGLNITYPFKETILDYLGEKSPEVEQVGSSNTVAFRNGRLIGFNTDYTGFKSAWRDAFGTVRPGVVFMLGAGGVGKAIAHGLMELGAAEIRILDIDRKRCRSLVKALSTTNNSVLCKAVEDVSDGLDGAEGLINATPVGMHAYPGNPLNGCVPKGIQYAVDAIYTPLVTEFLASAMEQGAQVLTGQGLCIFQAASSFEIWFGRPAPIEIMVETFKAAVMVREPSKQREKPVLLPATKVGRS